MSAASSCRASAPAQCGAHCWTHTVRRDRASALRNNLGERRRNRTSSDSGIRPPSGPRAPEDVHHSGRKAGGQSRQAGSGRPPARGKTKRSGETALTLSHPRGGRNGLKTWRREVQTLASCRPHVPDSVKPAFTDCDHIHAGGKSSLRT